LALQEALGGANAILGNSAAQPSRPGAKEVDELRACRPPEEARWRQALQRSKHLSGTLDLVNTALNEAYDQFQRLREEYESRVEECEFYELQCSRLDMHCHQLTEQLRGGRSFSAPGLHAARKHSLSLSSLRDASFWEHRFDELSQLASVAEAESPRPSASRQHVKTASAPSLPAREPGACMATVASAPCDAAQRLPVTGGRPGCVVRLQAPAARFVEALPTSACAMTYPMSRPHGS